MPKLPNAGDMANQEADWLQRQLQMGADWTRVNQKGPFGSQTWNGNTLETQYDPRLMEDFWGVMGTRGQERQAYGNQMGLAANRGEFNPTGLPGLQSGVGTNQYASGINRAGHLALPTTEGAFDDYGQSVEDAMFGAFTDRADRRFGQQRESERTRLRNAGFTAGSQGHDRAMQDLSEAETDAYQQAAQQARIGGQQASSARLADAMRLRSQQEQEGVNSAGIWNQGAGMDFQNRFANAQLGNQARSQGFGEQMAQYQMPFQMAAMSRTNQSPFLPSMGQSTTGLANPGGPSSLDFTRMQYGAGLDQRGANATLLDTGLGLLQAGGNNSLWNQGLGMARNLFGGSGGAPGYGQDTGSWDTGFWQPGQWQGAHSGDPFGVGGWDSGGGGWDIGSDPFGIGGW